MTVSGYQEEAEGQARSCYFWPQRPPLSRQMISGWNSQMQSFDLLNFLQYSITKNLDLNNYGT